MSEPIKNRYDFVVLFDVKNGNPNGDPDTGNMPRMDPETGIGLVTDACLKRKIRNYVDIAKNGAPGYKIYIRSDVPLEESDRSALEYLGVEDMKGAKKTDPEIEKKVRSFMCKNFFDIRTFGAVMTTFTKGGMNCGQVRGPVQIGFAHSIDPVVPQEITITRSAITTVKDAAEKHTEMGRKYIVPYGLYQVEGYISSVEASRVTDFSEDDLSLFWEAVINMFEEDHSAARGNMAVHELIVFKHEKPLGNAPSYKLMARIHVTKKEGVSVPRSYSDYDVSVDTKDLPDGVTVERLVK